MATPKSTHCKVCKEEFNDIVKKYRNHALCYQCYLENQRKRFNYKDNQITKQFKMTKRTDVYKARRDELKKCKDREEWLVVIRRNLDEILNQLKK